MIHKNSSLLTYIYNYNDTSHTNGIIYCTKNQGLNSLINNNIKPTNSFECVRLKTNHMYDVCNQCNKYQNTKLKQITSKSTKINHTSLKICRVQNLWLIRKFSGISVLLLLFIVKPYHYVCVINHIDHLVKFYWKLLKKQITR